MEGYSSKSCCLHAWISSVIKSVRASVEDGSGDGTIMMMMHGVA